MSAEHPTAETLPCNADLRDQGVWLTLTASLVQDAEYVQIKTATFARHAQQIMKLLVELEDFRERAHELTQQASLHADQCATFEARIVELQEELRIVMIGRDSLAQTVNAYMEREERAYVEPLATPVAYVPIHPTNGPLWANTIANLESDHPRHYKLMPLYALAVEPRAVPIGHFWRGEINRFYCKNCGGHYDHHLHTDEASLCPVADRAAPGETDVAQVHDPKDLPIEFVMDELHELSFSKRREFWLYLEQCLFRIDDDDGGGFTIAWPDGFSHLGREEFNAALQHAKQSTDKGAVKDSLTTEADKGAATPTDDGRCLCGRGKNFHPWRFCDQYQPTIVPNTPGAL